MKEKLLLTLISLLIILATGALFRYGEKVINQESKEGYSIFHFGSAEEVVSEESTEALSVKVFNAENKTNTYKLSFFVNDQLVSDLEKKIIRGKSPIIDPPDKLLEKVSEFRVGSSFDYSVEINWNDSRRVLTKKVVITHEK